MELGDRTDLPDAQRPTRAAHPRVGHTDGTSEDDKAVDRDQRYQREHPDPANTHILSTRTSAPTISSCTQVSHRAPNNAFTVTKFNPVRPIKVMLVMAVERSRLGCHSML